jgi:hypothetical protein
VPAGVNAEHGAGRAVRWLLFLGPAGLAGAIVAPLPAAVGLVFAAVLTAFLIDGFGALIAALAVRARIREFRFGTTRPAIRFRVGDAQVSLGIPASYWVNYGPLSTGRNAVALLGGVLANLAAAAIVLAAPLPRAIALSVAAVFAAHAVGQLIPLRWEDGRTSVGEQLLHPRSNRLLAEMDDFWVNRASRAHSPDRTNRVLAAYREGDPAVRLNAHLLAMMLRREGRVAELLELHAGSAAPDENKLDEAFRGSFVELEWTVLTVPGLPAADVDRAAGRLEALPRFLSPDRQASLAAALALARLRQGRFADVEPLCADALAGELEPDKRAQVLATVALARQRLGQPCSELIAEAQRLSAGDDLAAEAAATRMPDG